MGRTNKLVDGCYSFWQGGLFPLLQKVMPDYLAQTGVPCMPSYSSSAEGSSGGADVALEEEEVLQLTPHGPERQALDDLFRTKVHVQACSFFFIFGCCILRAAWQPTGRVDCEFHRPHLQKLWGTATPTSRAARCMMSPLQGLQLCSIY